ncbi:uncharacterized protein LOC144770929 isoform X3 [Lissotriton helveticus]
MDGLMTQEDAVPSKDWMKTTEETNRDQGDDSSSRNCKGSRYWAKAVVETDASSIDNQHSADMAKIDLEAHPSYKGNQKSMGLLRIEVEKGPSTVDDQHPTDLMKVDLATKLSKGCDEHCIDLTQIKDEAEPVSVDDQHPTDSIKMEVEEEHCTVDGQRSTDLMKVDLETKLSKGCDEHCIDLTQIKDEAEPVSVDDQHPTDSIKMEVEEEHCTVDGQRSTDLRKVDLETKLSKGCDEHCIDLTQIKDEAEPVSVDDQHPTDSIKMEVEEEHCTVDGQHSTDLMKVDLETKLSIGCDEHSIDLTQIKDEAEPVSIDDQHPTDSIKMEVEEEHCTADGQQKAAGERESSARVNKGPVRWVKIEVQNCAGDNQKVAKFIKMEDADELSSEFPQDATDMVKLEARNETYSEVCQDSSRLIKCEEEDPLARDSLGDMVHVKTEECDGSFHKMSPGLIKWVMFKTEADHFSRDSQDCEGGRSEHSSAGQWPNPRPLDVKNETRPERPSLEGRLTRKDLRDVLAELAAKEKDAPGVGAERVSLRHPRHVFSGEVHCNGVAKIIMMKPGSAPLSRNVVRGKNLDSVLPEHQTAAVKDQYKDVAGSPDCHEDDPCSSDTESSCTTENSESPSTGSADCHEDDPCSSDSESSGTGFPMIASVNSLRGTEEKKLHSAKHQESAPRKDISCNSGSPDCHEDDPCSSDSESSGTGFPMIASVFPLRATEEKKRHSAEHQESALRKDISCNSGSPDCHEDDPCSSDSESSGTGFPMIASVFPLRGTEEKKRHSAEHQESAPRKYISCNSDGTFAVRTLKLEAPETLGNNQEEGPTPEAEDPGWAGERRTPRWRGRPEDKAGSTGFPMIASVFPLRGTEEKKLHSAEYQESAPRKYISCNSDGTFAVRTLKLEAPETLGNNQEEGPTPEAEDPGWAGERRTPQWRGRPEDKAGSTGGTFAVKTLKLEAPETLGNNQEEGPTPEAEDSGWAGERRTPQWRGRPEDKARSTGFPMIASVFPLRGTEEKKLHSAEHQESAPRKDISCNSELPLITSVYTLRGTEDALKQQESVLRSNINCNAGVPAVSLLFIGNVLQPLMTPLNTQKGQPAVSVMTVGDQRQPLMLPPIPQGIERVAEFGAGQPAVSVMTVGDQRQPLMLPPIPQGIERVAEFGAGQPAVSKMTVGDQRQPLMLPLNPQGIERVAELGAGHPAVSVMTVGDQRQPLMLPPNPEGSERVAELGAGDPSTPAMKTGSEHQPVMLNANNAEGKRVSEQAPGGVDPSVRIVLNKVKDLSSPASTQKQKRIDEPDEEFPVITSVFTLRDTEEEDLQSVDNPESERSKDVNFDSGIPMITAVFTLRDEEELQQDKRKEKGTKRKESTAQDPAGNFKPEGSRKMKYSARHQLGPGPYTCSVCGKTFVHYNLFSRHEATHKVLKHYKCPVCGDTFNQEYRLLAHKKTHTVKRPKYMPFILPKPTF